MEYENILGYKVVKSSYQSIVDVVAKVIALNRKIIITALNAEKIVYSKKHSEVLWAISRSDIVIPDGVGIVWASMLSGGNLYHRITGIDLMDKIIESGVRIGARFYLMGGKHGVAEKTKEYFLNKYPGTNFSGTTNGYDYSNEELVKAINDSGANILFVANSSPKQAIWIFHNKKLLNMNCIMGVGGAFDVYAGLTKRAPLWMRKIGLEWLYRIFSDPLRIGHLFNLIRYVGMVIDYKLKRFLERFSFVIMLKDLKKYSEYLKYSSKVQLRLETAGTFLGYLWLILEPLAFMLIYTFVVNVIFKTNKPFYHLFVLIGIIVWQFTSKSILGGASSISKSKQIIDQVGFRKFILPTVTLLVQFYRFLISITVFLILTIISGFPITWRFLEFIPITFVLGIFVYGMVLICSHVGVYLLDLKNILDIVLRFMFYLTPVMWLYENLKLSWIIILKLNPISYIIQSYRDVFLYGNSPNYIYLVLISLFGIILIYIGHRVMRKRESEYGKVL